MKKIAISGPGRSGTSLLVKLFGAWGFSVPPEEGNWSEEAQAGLEARIGGNSGYEVDKDPWAFQYFDSLTDDQLAQYQVMLVPLRSASEAAISRSVQERFNRMSLIGSDHWEWNFWGSVPGGAIFDTSAAEIQRVLESGLWTLLEAASRRQIDVQILHFPTFARDFDYLWSRIGRFVQDRITMVDARQAWLEIVDYSMVRVSNAVPKFSAEELLALTRMQKRELENQRGQNEALRNEVAALSAELEKCVVQIEHLSTQLHEESHRLGLVQNSRSWRYTRILRRTLD